MKLRGLLFVLRKEKTIHLVLRLFTVFWMFEELDDCYLGERGAFFMFMLGCRVINNTHVLSLFSVFFKCSCWAVGVLDNTPVVKAFYCFLNV